MADISMCFGKGCKIRANCHRFTAMPGDYWQTYADFEKHYLSIFGDQCDYFWNNEFYRGEREFGKAKACLRQPQSDRRRSSIFN